MKRKIVKRQACCETYPFCGHAQNADKRITLTLREIEALGEILDLAHADQQDYLNVGDPRIDYGDEWPFTAHHKAETFRHIAAIGKKLGLNGEIERWNSLAKDVQASGEEYAEMAEPCPNCGIASPVRNLKPIADLGERVAPGEPMPAGECPECGALCHLKAVLS